MNGFLSKAFFISLCTHLAVFSLVTFSFSPGVSKAGVYSISCLDVILPNPVYNKGLPLKKTQIPSVLADFFKRVDNASWGTVCQTSVRKKRQYASLSDYLKPNSVFHAGLGKTDYAEKEGLRYHLPRQRQPPIFIFHPILPATFSLYFRDRQLAHVELAYSIVAVANSRLQPIVKRKISSGNLEVDLLCKRYITNYLFAQRLIFSSPSWQVVKIDLSEKSD